MIMIMMMIMMMIIMMVTMMIDDDDNDVKSRNCFTKHPAPAWFPASTRPRSFEGTGRKGSDLLTPGQKPAKLLTRLSVACVQSFFRVH